MKSLKILSITLFFIFSNNLFSQVVEKNPPLFIKLFDGFVEEEVVLNPILKKSLNLCKKEFSAEIAEAVLYCSVKYNIPVYVIYAIIATESGPSTNHINEETIMNVNHTAESKFGCIGLMQISPKFALKEYNKYYKTNYTKNDLINIKINIEVGTWFYSNFTAITKDWIELYIIYNVGYSEYNKINKNWFYGYDGKWKTNQQNKFFYKNDFLPPNDSKHGLDGKNSLKKYEARRRFAKCLYLCKRYFDT